MVASNPMRVLISGAGVAGPTLAWWLARTGTHITVVEKALSPLSHGQNVDIQGGSIKVIKNMGLLETVKRNNTNEKGTQFIKPDGQSFAPLPVSEGTSASLSSEFEILRGDLAKLLYEHGKDLANVQYKFGTTIKEVISNDDESVKVEFSDGKQQEFDLLVAADGQWSRVRKQCFAAEEVTSKHMGMYAVYFTIPRLPIDNDWWNVYFGLGSRIVTLRPDPHGTIRAMFTMVPRNGIQKAEWHQAEQAGRAIQQELVKRTFSDVGWQAERILSEMGSAPDFYFHTIQQIKMSTWSNSRVVCLGDTAYAPSPLTGMGTSLAIMGSYILAGELSKLDVGEHPARALKSYEEGFRDFVTRMQEVPSIFPGIAHPEQAWKRTMLHGVVRTVSVIAKVIKNKSAEEQDDGFILPEYRALNGNVS